MGRDLSASRKQKPHHACMGAFQKTKAFVEFVGDPFAFRQNGQTGSAFMDANVAGQMLSGVKVEVCLERKGKKRERERN